MKSYLFRIICLFLISLLLTGYLGYSLLTLQPSDGPDIPDDPDTPQPVITGITEHSPLGFWYEQEEYGGTLEVSDSVIVYHYTFLSGEEYSSRANCRMKEGGSRILIETKEEDFFPYVDMYYDRDQDIIVGYTWPVLDGDGGYHYTEFARTAYVAPPPPVYDPAVDLSDPDARKTFDDLTIRHMSAAFYDEGPYHDPSSSMAMEPPYPDYYSYDLTVQEDGSALVSSSFCREIDIPKEVVDELQELILTNDLGSINGIDIHTPGLPYDAPDYEVELELMSGEIIRSSANGPDVPENWGAFQESMHYLLFFAFMDAGYQLNGEFHSTKPMKRIGIPEEDRDVPDIQFDTIVILPDWEKSYDYSLDTKYPVFTGDSDKYPALMETLEELSTTYKDLAEEDLQKDYEAMEAVPESVWKEADRLYCYSFYAVEYSKCFGPILSFFLSEGHANSLGVGEYGYGYYPNHNINIDIETGKILAFSDLFTDPETACDVVCRNLRNAYSDYREIGQFIHSDEFPERLREYIDKTDPEGLNWFADYHSITVCFPRELFSMEDYTVTSRFYYDEMQDDLNDTYTSVW